MEVEKEIKELEIVVDEMKNYPVKITWKQLWVIATTAITIIGSSFGIGMKVAFETAKIERLKIERECKSQLATKDDEIIEVKRKLKESMEDNNFYIYRYNVMKERIDKYMQENEKAH